MNLEAEKTRTLKVQIPSRTLASTLLESWSKHVGVSVHILRGRITPDDACFELEVSGVASAVADVLRWSQPWAAGRKSQNQVPTSAPA